MARKLLMVRFDRLTKNRNKGTTLDTYSVNFEGPRTYCKEVVFETETIVEYDKMTHKVNHYTDGRVKLDGGSWIA